VPLCEEMCGRLAVRLVARHEASVQAAGRTAVSSKA
jgi:hypothetical protein